MKFHHRENLNAPWNLLYNVRHSFTLEAFQEHRKITIFFKVMLMMHCDFYCSALRHKYILIRKATKYKQAYVLCGLHQVYEKGFRLPVHTL